MANQSVSQKRRRAKRRLNIFIAAGVVLFVVALAILVDSSLYYNKVHAGVNVAGDQGLSLGGLSHDEAVAKLSTYVHETLDNPIILKSGDNTWNVLPSDVGLELDVEGAVINALNVTRDRNFVVDLLKRFKLYFSDEDVALEGAIDDSSLDEVIADVARRLDVPPVNASVAIENGQVRVLEGKEGNVVDREALRGQLEAILFTLHATEIAVPMVVKEPDVKAEDNASIRQLAETMISGPIVVASGGSQWTLEPEKIVAYMDFASQDVGGISTPVPYISADKMDPFFDKIAEKVATKPVNATFKSDGTKAWVEPGVPGKALDREKTAEAITQASLKATGRTAQVVVKTTEPELSTEKAKAMGITDRLASYTTEYGGTADRQNNVRITTEYATDVKLASGEVYDFERIVGPRTEARGYRKAPGIVGPGKLEDVYGGGICQVSTTMYNAAFFAGLEIVERWNHSIYIDHYPKGRDATVTVEGKNLRFRNDTGHWIWIRGTSDGVTTTINIYGTDDGREVDYTTSDFYNIVQRTETSVTNTSLGVGTTAIQINGQNGRQISVKRTITWPDGRSRTDKFVSTFPMYQKVIEVGTKPPTSTTVKTTTTTTKPGPSTTATTPEPGPTSTVVTEF
ncbi:MAG: VanW family protein [Thermoleophilia bacterium]|nr:VanW family protein [Thermoleophilia bacterium]